MATTADLTQRINVGLREIGAEADFLPELAAGWAEESAAERDVWYLEWRELMGRLEELERSYRAGAMAAEQRGRYRELLEKLRAASPLLEQLGLPLPTVSLTT
jgi:hypothetical protein